MLEDAELILLGQRNILSYHEGDYNTVGYRILMFDRADLRVYGTVANNVDGYWEDLAEAVRYARRHQFSDDFRTPIVYYGPEIPGRDWK